MNNSNTTILISTFGSSRLGTGHLFRSITLGKFIKKFMRVVWHINDSPRAKRIAKQSNIRFFASKNINSFLKNIRPDLVIYDKPFLLGAVPRCIKPKGNKLLGLDYFYYNDESVDCMINLINHRLKMIGNRSEKVLSGLKYAIIRDEIIKWRRKHKIRKSVINVLITFGGADPKNNTLKALQLIEKAGIVGRRIKIVLGPLFQNKGKIKSFAKRHLGNSVRVLDYTKRIGEVMVKSDLIFCGGGTTLLEVLCIGIPCIVIPQTQDEMRFVSETKLKTSVCLVSQDLSIFKMTNMVKRMFSNIILRKKCIAKGKKLIDGNGKKRIFKKIVDLLGEK
ncbi:MAG: glycosyltransferase [bacterium]